MRSFMATSRYRARHDPRRPGNRYLLNSRLSPILAALNILSRSDRPGRYLEVGAGSCEVLERLADRLENGGLVVGIDLLQEGLDRGKGESGSVVSACADAAELPFRDASFDVVTQVMMLSVVRNADRRERIASEMLRVLRPEGCILSLDLRFRAPLGMGYHSGFRRREASRIFPGTRIISSTHGLLPPLARALAPIAPGVCRSLERIPPLRVYRLDVIQKVA